MERRHFIKVGALGVLVSALPSCGKETPSTDTQVLVVGATPAGIMSAIAAARAGVKVTLIEYHNHIGGLSTSGLGKSDIENKNAILGLFKEFTDNILQYYITTYGADSENVTKCKQGYYYEPSVAERVFNNMLAKEANVTVVLNHQLEEVITENNKVVEAIFTNRASRGRTAIKAQAFVDATYEGDLYALAGAAYRLGREGKDEYNEAHAGRIFFDYNENEFLSGSTGEADKHLPAYTYRLCLTDDPANSYILESPPAGYDRNNYLKYFGDLKEGRLSGPKVFKEGHGYYKEHFDTMVRVFSFAQIPNNKFDVNTNPRPLGFPFPEENSDYVEAHWPQREKVFQRHRELALGLLYFIQNDSEVDENHRMLANKYHLAKDEFTDNEHFPWQLYVREARRLKGLYTLTENDVTLSTDKQRTTIFEDSIIAGEFPIDSFPVTKEPSADHKVLQGYIGMLPISPYQIPYRILIPETIDGVIVPVAASTTHVAYSTVRMEPLWMGIGQAAGIAAAHGIQSSVALREVDIAQLQKSLIDQNQILSYFDDYNPSDKGAKAAQFWGTKGFFTDYHARLNEPITRQELTEWLAIASTVLDNPDLKSDATVADPVVSVQEFAALVPENHSTWLEEQRDEQSPVRRGEVCLALYTQYQPS